MFHEGSLQDGISKALQESKSVLCFVTDGGAESNKWENEWLLDQNIPNAVDRHAIAIRLLADSEEAGFLAAVCPVDNIPTIAVIRQGQLRDQLKAGISKNQFTLKLLQAIRPASQSTPSRSAPPQDNGNASSSVPTPTTSSSSANTATTTNLESLQPPRAPSSPPKAPTDPPTGPSTDSRRKQRESYEQEQARRKKEAKAERARILRDIENDRIERRRREEQRKIAVQATTEQASSLNGDTDPAISLPQQKFVGSSDDTTSNIQIRFPDGSTTRKAFPASTTIGAVRTWINEQSGKSGPYSLKLVLTPLPSRTVSQKDDKHTSTLAELGLAPSATLVMIPAGPAGAAAAVSSGRILSNAYDIVLAWIMWLFGMIMHWGIFIFNKLKVFLGLGGSEIRNQSSQRTTITPSSQSGHADTSSAESNAKSTGVSTGASKTGGVRIRTLRDQRAEQDQDKNQFYNGNRLSFEPSTNDKDDKDQG